MDLGSSESLERDKPKPSSPSPSAGLRLEPIDGPTYTEEKWVESDVQGLCDLQRRAQLLFLAY